MKKDKTHMKQTGCEEYELLIDEYLEGMITAEDKQRMESHLAGCKICRSYLESTVILIEKAVLLGRNDGKELVTSQKQNELWSKIEAKINASLPVSDGHIYNMSGLEDEYIPAPSAGSTTRNTGTPAPLFSWSSMRYYVSGIAAVLILAFVIYGVNQFMKRGTDVGITDGIVEVGGPKWMVTSIKGNPLINNLVMKAIDSLAVGGYITTDDSSKAELYVAGLGSVIIEPGSKVKLVKSTDGEHRIQLDYGSIDANIFAAPRTFFVDAGSVTAVDLGCSYKFSMDKAGDGLLYVRSGKVALESASGRESLVPEGKFCVTKQNIGPGTPFREDSSPELKKALMEFDFGSCGAQCVNTIIKSSKKTDAVTLVNILPRVDEQYKAKVYDRVAYFYPAPKNIPADSIPRLKRLENVNEWVDEIMEEVQKNIEENMARVEEHMKKFDNEKWQKQWQENWEKNVKKNWNFNYRHNYGTDTMTWNSESMPSPEEMEELQKDLQEMQKGLHLDNEEFKQEMDKVKEELKKVNEEIQKEMQKVQSEVEKEKHKVQKEKERIDKEKKEIDKANEKNNDSGDDDLDNEKDD